MESVLSSRLMILKFTAMLETGKLIVEGKTYMTLNQILLRIEEGFLSKV